MGDEAAAAAAEPSSQGPARLLNVNVGVLGHVDSGKTSLVSALSTTLSTAALDKHPQSKERGITLDLGFSSFLAPIPEHITEAVNDKGYSGLQITLVDCPGHASLIKTILGGAQIIDMMILVIDVTKGIQAQTAECIVVGELTTDSLVIALNKIDMLPEDTREKQIKKAAKRLKATFAATKFANCPIFPVAAKGLGGEGDDASAPVGMTELVAELTRRVQPPAPVEKGFLFAVDHCFPIKGQGTVLTGTVLRGSIKVNDTLELPELKLQRKVKSMQMFKRPAQQLVRGDRAGICVTKLDAKLMERGLAGSPSAVPTFQAAVASVEKIRFFSGQVASKAKFNVTIGHTAALADMTFFGLPPASGSKQQDPEAAMALAVQQLMLLTAKDSKPPAFDFSAEYLYQEELYGLEGRPRAAEGPAASQSVDADAPADEDTKHHGPQWALIRFDRPITVPQDSLLIGARFDMENSAAACRLALYGRMLAVVAVPGDPSAGSGAPGPPSAGSAAASQEQHQGAPGAKGALKFHDLKSLRVYKPKQKQGQIDRIDASRTSALCKGLLKKETDISPFLGLKVVAAGGEEGVIESSFGKSGKFNVRFPGGLLPGTGKGNTSTITLNFKRYVFDEDSKKSMAMQ